MKKVIMLIAAIGAISAAVFIATKRRKSHVVDDSPWPDDYLDAEIIVHLPEIDTETTNRISHDGFDLGAAEAAHRA